MANPEPKTQTIAETDNYLAWSADEPDGEKTFHLELNNVTLHFFQEEWMEFLDLARMLVREADKRSEPFHSLLPLATARLKQPGLVD
jgi:hypothetical protein